jgi:AraC-like DNA-binding protein
MGPSTLSSWALLIARALAKHGVDAEALFSRARMRFDQLHDPNARYPLAAIYRLWSLAEEATSDPCFGLEVGESWHPTSFHALGYSALAAASLGEAFGYLARYSRIVSSGARVEVTRTAAEVVVKLMGREPLPHTAAAVQAGLAAIVVLCRCAKGDGIAPSRVHFMHHDNETRARLERFFGCGVAFDSPYNGLAFPRRDVDAPLPGANAALLRVNAQALHRYAARIDSQQLADRVREHIVHLLPSAEADQARVAREINMSSRNLQRKLKDEGFTFRELVDDTRKRLAEQYAEDSTLSSSEVAYLLGFTEPSSFVRAKRRWKRRDSPDHPARAV